MRFNKNVFTLRIPLKEGIGGEKEAQREGEEDTVTLRITLINCRIFGNPMKEVVK
jgi:hypothetical protein